MAVFAFRPGVQGAGSDPRTARPGRLVRGALPAGEQVVWRARRHWVALAWPSALVLAGLAGAARGSPWLAAVAVPAALVLGRRVVAHAISEVALTDHGCVIVATGTLHPNARARTAGTLRGVGVDEGVWGLILGYGTLILYDRDWGRERVGPLASARELARRIDEQAWAMPSARRAAP